MVDTVAPEKRSRMMAAVRQKNTPGEVLLRKQLHRLGFRYRLHESRLPGSPDLVFPRYNAVIFVHGCYWHAHGCYRSTIPRSNRQFWLEKFAANRERDRRNINDLLADGKRVLVVWECSLFGKESIGAQFVADIAAEWLCDGAEFACIQGGSRTRDRALSGLYRAKNGLGGARGP